MSLLDKATIITTPTAHSNGKLHSIKGGSVADFDVVRNSVATRVASNGLIESVATNIPRIDYTTGEGVILTEPQSTNLITYSEDFSDAYWSKSGASVVGGFASPSADIPLGAFKLVESVLNERHYVVNQIVNASGLVCGSVYAKFLSRYLRLTIHDTTNSNEWYSVVYDLQNGTIYDSLAKTVTIFDSKIEQMSNGYYRCAIIADLGVSSSVVLYVQTSDGAPIQSTDNRGRTQYQGDGTSGIHIWGAQLEALSHSTSYIPTSGAIATRLADEVTGAGDATTINSTEGVLYAEIASQNDGNYKFIALSDGTITNRIGIFLGNSNNKFSVESTGSGVNLGIYDKDIIINNFNKIALKYKANDCSLWLNGVEIGIDTTFTSFSFGTLNTLDFGRGDGNFDFYGKTKTIAVFSEALSDEELTCLTTI